MSDQASPQDMKFFSPWISATSPSPKGEWRMRCPFHNDRNPSASINFTKGVFRCTKQGCVGGMKVESAKRRIMAGRTAEPEEKAAYDPFATGKTERAVKADTVSDIREVSEAKVKRFKDALLASRDRMEELMRRRGISEEMILKYDLGWESKTKRYVIPIRDERGRCMNLRKYQMDAPEDSQKITNHMEKDWGDVHGFGSPPRLFPLAVLEEHPETSVFVVEGELDALVLLSRGITAVSGTGGAGKWEQDWSDILEGRDVVLMYDNDPDGRKGAHKAKMSLLPRVNSLVVCTDLVDKPGGDVSDYFLSGGDVSGLIAHVEALPEEAVLADQKGTQAPKKVNGTAVPEMVTTSIVGTMEAATNGQPLYMTATVTGKKNPTFSVPASGRAVCSLDAGPKCNHCPMFTLHEGDLDWTIGEQDVGSVSVFIDAPTSMHEENVRKHIGAKKCGQLKVDVEEVHTVQELFVAAPIDSDEDDFTSRRVYTIGDTFETATNTVSNLSGTTWPNPKDSRNEFYAWDVQDATTNIESFEVTPEFVERMKQFRPRGRQKPIDKAREIASHMGNEVTHIFDRERLHMAMDLVWHSVLSFPFNGDEPIRRGWLEMIVVGDTRTGKSEAAMKMSKHYGLGHLISCENASVAGLIGGATQIGQQWTLQWGDYTLNDRRLVVLDEVSGMSTEVISAMTNVRSSGEAQITKIEAARTRARVRSVWISNPRQAKYIDNKQVDGIDILSNVIASPEDIARFDIAMSVREGDVRSSVINRRVGATEATYSSDDCRDLILWAWSRRWDQVVWDDGALDKVFEMADKMGGLFMPSPPLIERASVKEKIARLAVALAVRTFSATKDGECVLVQKRHVVDVCRFLYQLYSYDNFGYKRRSDRIKRNRQIAQDSIPFVRGWLRSNMALTEFLIDIDGSFRAQDVEEMAHMDRDDVQTALALLSERKMISKTRAQIVMEPTLQELLREFG